MSDTIVSTTTKTPTASDPAYAELLASLPGFDREVKTTLGQEDFLKLLSVQLANQDPLNPQNDLNSISQMATFSSIEQMGDLVTSLKAFMTQQNWISAGSYLGQWVSVVDGSGITVTGLVDKIAPNSDGYPALTIGGVQYALDDVTAVFTSDPSVVAAPVEAGGNG